MRLIIHDYAGHPFQVQLSRELARRGHTVTHAFAGGLLTPRGNLVKKPGDPPTFSVVEVPMDPNYRRDKYKFLRRRRMEIEYGHKAAALIASEKPDAFLSANTPTEPQLTIAKACTSARVAFMPWVQDFYSIAVAKLAGKKLPGIGHLMGWWYHHLENSALRQSAAVVSITDDFVPILRQSGVVEKRITVIPNWAPLDELPQRPRRNSWSGAHGLDDKFVFVYSGTLAMKHNPDLLRQLSLAFRGDPAVRVLVISEGPGADFLRERKAAEKLDNLELLPFQAFEDMPDVLASADVLVAVLEAEAGIYSVPSKVLTYHCAGKPLLGAIPGLNLSARIITKEGTGICVEPSDASGFLKAATKLRSDPALREKQCKAARAYAETHFDISRIATRFEDCFRSAGVGK